MKKILLLLLFLVFSGNTFAKIINLECKQKTTNQYTNITIDTNEQYSSVELYSNIYSAWLYITPSAYMLTLHNGNLTDTYTVNRYDLTYKLVTTAAGITTKLSYRGLCKIVDREVLI